MVSFDKLFDPPQGSNLTMRRRGNSVEFTGLSRNRTDDRIGSQLEAMHDSRIAKVAPGCGSAFTSVVKVFFGLPVVGAVMALVLFPPQNMRMEFVLALLAFCGVWCTIGWAFIRHLNSLSGVQTILSKRPWRLQVSDTEIRAVQDMLVAQEDHRVCNPADVQRVSVTPDGYLIAHLAGESESATEMVLSGSLEQTEANWLLETLSRLLGVDGASAGTSTSSRAGNSAVSPPKTPAGFRLMSDPVSVHFEVSFQHDLRTRLVGATVVLLFAVMFGIMFLGMAGKGPADLRNFPFDEWWPTIMVTCGIGISVFFAGHLINIVFGTTQITATQEELVLKHRVGLLALTKRMDRADLIHFRQIQEEQMDSEGSESPNWRLVAHGGRELRLLRRQDFEQCDWLGRQLAAWFDVPFIKAHEQ